MNEQVPAYDKPKANWFKEHPSWSITIVVAVFSGMQWAGVHLRKDLDEPQWKKVNDHLSDLSRENRHMATYTLERGRHTDNMLTLIAKSAGIKDLEGRPLELDRSELRVRKISERDD